MFNYLYLLKVVLKQQRLLARLRNEISMLKKDRDRLRIIEAENHALKSIFQDIEQQHITPDEQHTVAERVFD